MSDLRLEDGRLHGPGGSIAVSDADGAVRKLLMLIEGECLGLGATAAAAKYGFCRQRYYQVLAAFSAGGASALADRKRGPKTNYRRTEEVERQVIRHRYLDADASAAVIAQRLRQAGHRISERSVLRVIEQYGLEKKTVQGSAQDEA